MRELKCKKNVVFYIVALIAITGLFSVYYYGIQKTFAVDEEALESLISVWDAKRNGTNVKLFPYFIRTLCSILIPLFGLSYRTVRVAYTILYAIYTILLLDIVLRRENGKMAWSVLPVYMLFMVLLPITQNNNWGKLGNGWYQYPFNQHPEAMLCTLVGIWLLRQIYLSNGMIKKVCVGILAIWSICGLFIANQIYIIAFFAPFLLFVLVRVAGSGKIKNIGTKALALLAVLYLILKVLSIKFDQIACFFGSADQSDFFKSTAWSKVGNWPSNICNYIQAIISMYGCDYTLFNIYNITIVLYGIKLILVIFAFCMMVKKLKSTDNAMEFVISWGYLLLSVFWIFSEYAQNLQHHMRYLMIFIPYAIIIICLHLDEFGKWIRVECFENAKNLCIIASLLCVALFPYNEWNVTTEDPYDREYREVIETVESRGLNTGIWTQSFSLGNAVYVTSGGKHKLVKGAFQDNGNTILIPEEEGEIYDYLVIEDNGNIGDTISSEEVYNFLCENIPDDIVEICDGSVKIYIYQDGIPYMK